MKAVTHKDKLHNNQEDSLPGTGKGVRLFSVTKPGSLIFHIAFYRYAALCAIKSIGRGT